MTALQSGAAARFALALALRLPGSVAASASGLRTSCSSVLLPAPLRPQRTVRRPAGKATSMFFKLWTRASFTVNQETPSFGPQRRREPRIGWTSGAPRRRPVAELVFLAISRQVPSATIRPPLRPAPGPRSRMRSARFIVSSSCSTTTRVFPFALSASSESRSRALSRGWRPMVGSSRT